MISVNRRTSTRAWLAVACLLTVWAVARPLAAQRAWRSSVTPVVYFRTLDGAWGGARYRLSSAIGFGERPEPDAGSLLLEAGASTQGSYRGVVDAHLPALWAGWRLRLTLSATRDNRYAFYGLGNDTPYSADSVTADAPYFYRASRTRSSARLTLQRRVVGPLRLLAGASIGRTRFRDLPGPGVFARDSTFVPFTDKTVRAGLVLDTRDNEFATHSGVILEALYATGSGYTRTTGSARVFIHPITRLVFAARLAGEDLGGTAPLAPQLEMESSELPFGAVGGYRSLRGYYGGRFVGPGKLLGGIEVRYAPVWVPSAAEVMLVGFYDAGRVFGPGESFQLTTRGLHHGVGTEVAVRIQRNTLFVAGVAKGRDGVLAVFGTQWSY